MKKFANNTAKMVEVEGEIIAMEEFININLSKDVEPISRGQISDLWALPIAQSMYIGIVEVKRIDEISYHKKQFQDKAEQDINVLKAMMNSKNEIEIYSETFIVTKVNKYSLEAIKARSNSRFIISCSPNSSVIENKELPIYFILRNGKKFYADFTIMGVKTIPLTVVKN